MMTMEEFLKTYGFENLLQIFESHEIKDDNFFSLTETQIITVLKDHLELLLDFLSKFNLEKGKINSILIASENDFIFKETNGEVCETDKHAEKIQEHRKNSEIPEQCNSNVSVSSEPSINQNNEMDFNLIDLNVASSSNAGLPSNPPGFVDLVKNDLYYFLNSTVEGDFVLKKYKNLGVVDYSRLKHLIIYKEFEVDPINLKISADTFSRILKDFVELFPTEDDSLFYVPFSKGEGNEVLSARGALYNYYKLQRRDFREVGLLKKGGKSDKNIEASNAIDDNLFCLTNGNQQESSLVKIISNWEVTYKERNNLLSQKEKKKHLLTIEKYFRSFPCVCSPHGILLLEIDFQQIFKNYKEENLIPEDTFLNYSKLFSTKWPALAEKILLYCKQSKSPKIKKFLEEHSDLVNAATHDNLLAFFLIPICIKAVLSKNDRSLTKEEISNSFILHVKEAEDLSDAQSQFEDWLRNRNFELLPYLICVGKLENAQFYVVLNDEKYSYTDCIKAVEACYKCLAALGRHSPISDFVWTFFDRTIYNLSFKRANSFVTKFIQDLSKLEVEM